jgi:hypothetical protein
MANSQRERQAHSATGPQTVITARTSDASWRRLGVLPPSEPAWAQLAFSPSPVAQREWPAGLPCARLPRRKLRLGAAARWRRTIRQRWLRVASTWLPPRSRACRRLAALPLRTIRPRSPSGVSTRLAPLRTTRAGGQARLRHGPAIPPMPTQDPAPPTPSPGWPRRPPGPLPGASSTPAARTQAVPTPRRTARPGWRTCCRWRRTSRGSARSPGAPTQIVSTVK